jgi:Domain of unknown function (DUF4375)
MSIEESKEDSDLLRATTADVYRDCDDKRWSPYRLRKPLFVCWAVEQAQEKVNNGGFQYFFENDWERKPPYDLFIKCFDTIGAEEAVRCLEKAVALFPFPEPHLDYKKRREFMDLCEVRDGKYNSEFDKLGHEMMDLSGENYTKLAAYVRANIDAFPSAKVGFRQT